MELTLYQIALISGGFGIVGMLIGVLATYYLTLKITDKQFLHMREISKIDAWHVAASEFNAAFANELAILESDDIQPLMIKDFLFSAYETKHQAAIATFQHFIPNASCAAFNAACQKYHSNNKDICDGVAFSYKEAMFSEYNEIPFNSPEIKPHELAVQRIRDILEFAKHY